MTTNCSASHCERPTARLLLDGAVGLCVGHLLALEGGKVIHLGDGGRLSITGRWPRGKSPAMRSRQPGRFWR
jgi:hypothetical protein